VGKEQLVFISTIHRMAERMITAAVDMSDKYDITLVNLGQASKHTDYAAKDRYQIYIEENQKRFMKILDSPKLRSKRDIGTPGYRKGLNKLYDTIDWESVACVVMDDSRNKNAEAAVYQRCNDLGVPVIANAHGNMNFKSRKKWYGHGQKGFFDRMFVFGSDDRDDLITEGCEDFFLLGGIPSNDALSDVRRKSDYILVITNFLLKHQLPQDKFECGRNSVYDKEALEAMRLLELQKKLNKPVVFKVKHRIDTDLVAEIRALEAALPKGLMYTIIPDHPDENQMLGSASCVLTYGSTVAFKPIQMSVPTVIFEELGYVGNFRDYPGVVSLGDDYSEWLNPLDPAARREFLEPAIEGGSTFTSTQAFIRGIEETISELR
jgi:hypothetical protein